MFFGDKYKYKKVIKKYKEKEKELTLNEILKEHEILKNQFCPFSAINIVVNLIKIKKNHTINERQIAAAFFMFNNKIIEMKTGEGKTYVAIITAYLNNLKKLQSFIIVPNDYLSKRDSNLANEILSDLNIKITSISDNEDLLIKKLKYSYHIIYTKIDNIVFDYLRDRKRVNNDYYIRKMDSIIIDEADLVLIDKATKQLMLTNGSFNNEINYFLMNRLVKSFNESDYEINHESKNLYFNNLGYEKIENIFLEQKIIENKDDIYLPEKSLYIEALKYAILANTVYKINIDYIIRSNQIVLIDEKTGRINHGSSFQNGLQQAIQAFNKIEITKEHKSSATITIPIFVKKFKKLCGMTGTIKVDSSEIKNIYNTDIIEIEPFIKPKRIDRNDLIFFNKENKLNYLINIVSEIHKTERPILIGTLNIEDTYIINQLLKEKGLDSIVLNAENHYMESEIIKSAGKRNMITIATNMAGRGTDIVLGGVQEEYENIIDWEKENNYINSIGGLYVIGFERSSSRRLDNQLIGRSGRQGNNGESIFLISLDDSLLNTFDQNLRKIFESFNIKNDAIENVTISRAIFSIQKRIDGINYDKRKSLYTFDGINEDISKIYYELRDNFIINKDKKNVYLFLINKYLETEVESYFPYLYDERTWKINEFKNFLKKFEINIEIDDYLKMPDIDQMFIKLNNLIKIKIEEKVNNIDDLFYKERITINILMVLDQEWESIIKDLEFIKQKSNMKKNIQKIPTDEYKKELLNRFENLLFNLSKECFLYLNYYSKNKNDMINDFYFEVFNKNLFIDKPILGISKIKNIGF